MEEIDQLKTEVDAAAQQAKAESEELSRQLEEEVKEAPKWKLILLAVLALCAAGYLCWCRAHTPAPRPSAFTPAAPAVTAPKVAGPSLKKPLQVVPKQALRKSFGPAITVPSGSAAIDTAEIPAAENGVQTVTFLNLSTGTASTVYRAKPAPWFALEGKNEVSAGIEAGSRGQRIPVEYRRDLARIKDLHLVVQGGVKIPAEPKAEFEWNVGARAAYRW